MVRLLALLLLAAALASCRPAEPVRIGFVGGLSGRVADLGVSGRNGAQLAIETLNAATDGPRYELRIEDDQHDPARMREAVASLARQQVAFIVGPMTSAMAVAGVPEIERLRIVMISPTANTHDLTGRDDHFFHVIADAPTGARQLADLLHRRGVKSMAVLMDFKNRSYAQSFGGAAVQRLRELGGSVTLELSYESGSQVEFGALTERLLAGKPQLVLLASSAVDAALAAQQLRRAQPGVGLAVTAWAANDQLLQLGARAVEGAIVQQAQDPQSPAPAYREFQRRYRERFGEMPSAPAVSSYDALMVGVQALRRQAPGQKLRDVLAVPAGSSWAGLQRTIALDANGDNTSPVHLSEVRDGRLASLGQ